MESAGGGESGGIGINAFDGGINVGWDGDGDMDRDNAGDLLVGVLAKLSYP